MKRDKGKGTQADRHALLAAAALQDHLARRLRMPGGPVAQPSLEPGAPLTLAQHLGLVPRPPPLLSEAEWSEVHLRSRLRQDSEHECVICREEFSAGAQVLLSCSHTFHRHCLAAFERFSRSRCCPLCRAESYQKRAIRDGLEAARHRAAVRIQAAWRGHAARRRYRQLRRHAPPRDERLRARWAAERLQEDADALLTRMAAEVGDLDSLFAELDASVAESRRVCDAALRPLAERLQRGLRQEADAEAEAAAARAGAGRAGVAAQRARGALGVSAGIGGGGGEEGGEEAGRPRPLALLESDLVAPAFAPAASAASAPPQRRRPGGSQAGAGAVGGSGHPAGGSGNGGNGGDGGGGGGPLPGAPGAAAVDWDAVVGAARARGSLECPICLGDIGRRGDAGIAWLSCTHCFHLDCIMAFEAFELASGGTPSCPVCRGAYRRRCFA